MMAKPVSHTKLTMARCSHPPQANTGKHNQSFAPRPLPHEQTTMSRSHSFALLPPLHNNNCKTQSIIHHIAFIATASKFLGGGGARAPPPPPPPRPQTKKKTNKNKKNQPLSSFTTIHHTSTFSPLLNLNSQNLNLLNKKQKINQLILCK
jgi:hypothetical protein